MSLTETQVQATTPFTSVATPGLTVAAGNLIVVFQWARGTSPTLSAPTDPVNTYTQGYYDFSGAGGPFAFGIWYVENCAALTSQAITGHAASSPTSLGMRVFVCTDFANGATGLFDAITTSMQNTTTTPTGVACTSTKNHGLFLYFSAINAGGAEAITSSNTGGGWTNDGDYATNNGNSHVDHQFTSVASTLTGTITLGTSRKTSQINVAFSETAGSALVLTPSPTDTEGLVDSITESVVKGIDDPFGPGDAVKFDVAQIKTDSVSPVDSVVFDVAKVITDIVLAATSDPFTTTVPLVVNPPDDDFHITDGSPATLYDLIADDPNPFTDPIVLSLGTNKRFDEAPVGFEFIALTVGKQFNEQQGVIDTVAIGVEKVFSDTLNSTDETLRDFSGLAPTIFDTVGLTDDVFLEFLRDSGITVWTPRVPPAGTVWTERQINFV